MTALFWFNPLVWLLAREVVQHAEQAADRKATEQVEPARYAQTLLTWAQDHGTAVPAHGIAPTAPALARRKTAVLDERMRERPRLADRASHADGYNRRWITEADRRGGLSNLDEQDVREIDVIVRREYRLPQRGR